MPSSRSCRRSLLVLCLVSLGCNENVVSPGNGALVVTVTLSGSEPNLEGYTVEVDALPVTAITSGVIRRDLPAGTHRVELGGVPPGCHVVGENPRTITVEAGETTTLAFVISCAQKDRHPIAFVKNAPGLLGIFLIDADGNGLRKLTDGSRPVWSPDHSKIAFNSSDGISAINADGSGVVALTRSLSPDLRFRIDFTSQRWSPDGRTLAFVIDASKDGDFGGPFDIWLVQADGANPTRLVTNGSAPSWSPDGSRIAFVSNQNGNHEIFVIGADGSGHTRLTNRVQIEGSPQWSPDGTRILFETWASSTGPYDIATMNPDGTDIVVLTPGVEGWSPTWLPGGTIGFTSNRRQAAIMNPDGTGLRIVADDAEGSAWSPDGSQLAFARNLDRGGPVVDPEVYLVNADGTGLHNLSNSPNTYDVDPAW